MLDITNNKVSIEFACPDCNCKFGQATGLVFYGKYSLANCLCECCENTYLHTLPIGEEVRFPISYSHVTKKAKYDQAIKEQALVFIEQLNKANLIQATVTKKIITEQQEVILLNCLDREVGYVFMKLVNASKILKENPSKGLILLIPKSFESFVPKGISEFWLVDLPLEKFESPIESLDTFIKNEKVRFNRFYLYSSSLQVEIEREQLADYTNKAFVDLAKKENAPFQLCYILNRDKCWITNKLDSFLYASTLFSWLKPYFKWKERYSVKKLFQNVGSKHSGTTLFYMVEVDNTTLLPVSIKEYQDKKMIEVNTEEWLSIYSNTHVAIGLEGSSMAIPSLLSASSIVVDDQRTVKSVVDFIMDNKEKPVRP